MNRIRNHSKELIVLTILLAVAVSVVNAAVFVYYPIDITASWSKRPIYFILDQTTNAGGPDLSETIEVTLREENTDADITVHPSRRGTTLYHNIMKIKNDDTQAYNIWIRVNTAFNDNSILEAYLRVGSTDIDLRTNNNLVNLGSLNGDSELTVSLKIKISSNVQGSDNASIDLIYSPQSNEPPPTP